MRLSKPFAILCATAWWGIAGQTNALEVLGTKPAHVLGGPSAVPNEQAISRMIWAPGIDDGYVPQGIALAEGAVLMSGYKSTDTKIDKGPCRVYKVDPQTGQTSGQFDLPEDCGHAGGLAYIGKGILIAADSRRLYKIDMNMAFRDGHTKNALLGTIKLGGEVKGSFVDFDGTSIFVGSYEKEERNARGFFLPLSLFETHAGKTVREDAAIRELKIAADAQGAAFDKAGNLWLTTSGSRHGSLRKIDAKSGQLLGQYEMVIGIEDIGFDDQGRLWSVSEAGSLRWSKWTKTFPVLFALDVGKLK